MTDISDFRAKVIVLIQDDALGISHTVGGDVDECIGSAVSIYSRDRPYKPTPHSFNGDGGYDYDLPSGWTEEFSRVLFLEYPTGSQKPNYLREEEYRIYNNGTNWKLRFLETSPSSGYSALLTYTTVHEVDTDSSTVYTADFEAVCHLAASVCCLVLADKYAQTSEPTIGADAVNYAAKTQQYSNRSKDLYKDYQRLMDRETEAEPASTTKDYDTDFIWGGSHLTHPKDYR